MVRDSLVAAYRQVNDLHQALNSGETGIAAVPVFLKSVLESEAWREFRDPMGKTHTHDDFETFVRAQPLSGLGADPEIVRDLIHRDRSALSAFDRARQRRPGRPKSEDAQESETVDIITSSRPEGTSAEKGLRRLRDSAPALHAQVIAGEKSVHAAMVEAGFRTRTFTVPHDIPRAARTLLRQFSDDEIELLVKELEAR